MSTSDVLFELWIVRGCPSGGGGNIHALQTLAYNFKIILFYLFMKIKIILVSKKLENIIGI